MTGVARCSLSNAERCDHPELDVALAAGRVGDDAQGRVLTGRQVDGDPAAVVRDDALEAAEGDVGRWSGRRIAGPVLRGGLGGGAGVEAGDLQLVSLGRSGVENAESVAAGRQGGRQLVGEV